MENQKSVLYLILLILFFSIRQITGLLLTSSENTKTLSHLLFVTDPLTYLIGPLILYYIKSIIEERIVFDYKMVLISIPCLIFTINLIPYYQLPIEEK